MKQINLKMGTFKLFLFIYLPIMVVMIFSCEELFNLEDGDGLSSEEIVDGLKTALEVGTDSATTELSLTDGYYLNDMVKIPLPEEAESLRSLLNDNTVSQYFNLDDEFENVVKSINKAAEEAANDAAPIFKDAITDLSISQGLEILQGQVPTDLKSSYSEEFDSTAATQYMRNKTYDALIDLYAPKINETLDEDLGLGFSANNAWTALTTAYNDTYNSTAVQLALKTNLIQVDLPDGINTDLGEFSTGKALDGLFYMVGEEEKKIRKDPFQWALDVLRKVFGNIPE